MQDWRHIVCELRRRHVCRAVLAYWVVAWTCIEASAVLEQALLLPAWLDQAVVIVAAAGLPVVAIVAWVFEWGPDGLYVDELAQQRHLVDDRDQDIARRIADAVYSQLKDDMARR